MRSGLALLLVFSFAVGGFAGCMSANPGPAKHVAAKTTTQRLLDVLEFTPPMLGFRKDQAVAWWESFVTTYAGRQWSSPKNAEAAAYLQQELAKAGYRAETLIMKSKPRVPLTGQQVPVDAEYRVVRGIREGDNASHRMALISHYDVIAAPTQTVQGAYDDGAGVAVEMEVCKLLAKVPTNKTIECLFFDAEEAGLIASEAYMNAYVADKGRDYVYDQAFGYDMTGLNWPGHPDWKLFAFVGLTQSPAFTESLQLGHMQFLNTTFYSFLSHSFNVSPKGVEVRLGNIRNSDEQRFEKIGGVPVVRFAGGYKPGFYPMYHMPGDTVPYVYAFACGNCTDQNRGREQFAKGVEMVVAVSYYTIMAYDKFDSMQIEA
jgi:hypothetical protein